MPTKKFNEMLIGQAGEYIAAAALLELGVQTMFSPTAGADLLAFAQKRYWRVEVKTTQSREKREGKNLYRWNTSTGSQNKSVLSSDDSDIVALVALDRSHYRKNHALVCKQICRGRRKRNLGRGDSMQLSPEMIVSLGAMAASFIGSFAVVKSKLSAIEEELKEAQKRLRQLDGRLDKNDTHTDLVSQRMSVISKMLDPTNRERLHRSLERLQVESETLRRDVDILQKMHNGRHKPVTGNAHD